MMRAVVTSPATPFKKPEMVPILSPCDWIWRPFKVEVAVAPKEVEVMPAAKVDDAVVVEIWSRSMSAVDEAISEYGTVFAERRMADEVAETDWS